MKSLFSTLLCYVVSFTILIIFVAVTGIMGALFLLTIGVVSLVYFYGGFKKNTVLGGKGHTL
jgi:nitrate/TMAO reductase-like tetraheme cytochrome c subunit